jgi:hypothetical protein
MGRLLVVRRVEGADLLRAQQPEKRLAEISYPQVANAVTRNANCGESSEQWAGITMDSLTPNHEGIREIYADAFRATKQLNCGKI